MKCLLEVRLNAYYQCNLAVAHRLYGIKKLHQREDNVKSGLLILGLSRNLHESKKINVGLYLFNMIQSFIKKIKSFYWKIITVPSNNKQKSGYVSMSGFCWWIAVDWSMFWRNYATSPCQLSDEKDKSPVTVTVEYNKLSSDRRALVYIYILQLCYTCSHGRLLTDDILAGEQKGIIMPLLPG